MFSYTFTVSVRDELLLSLNVLIAGVLGLLIGFERAHAGKVAGVRTHAFVSMAASAAVGAGALLFEDGDPSRVLHAIITGVGFLGAGAIFKHKSDLTGLTTAANLFFIAIIGALCGFGLYIAAGFCTALALSVLSLGRLNKVAQTKSTPRQLNYPKHGKKDRQVD